jgi:hypothetical protein
MSSLSAVSLLVVSLSLGLQACVVDYITDSTGTTTSAHSDLHTQPSTSLNLSRKLNQDASNPFGASLPNTSRLNQLESLGRFPPQRQRSASLSQFSRSQPINNISQVISDLQASGTTTTTTPSSDAQCVFLVEVIVLARSDYVVCYKGRVLLKCASG